MVLKSPTSVIIALYSASCSASGLLIRLSLFEIVENHFHQV